MKRRFFIFAGLVLCSVSCVSAFGDRLPNFDNAVYGGNCFEGNYEKMSKMLDENPSLVNLLSARYNDKKSDSYSVYNDDIPMFAMIINGCCRRSNQTNCGSNKKSDMARLFIEKGINVNSLVGSPLIPGKDHTLLDYVRYYKTKSGWCPQGSNTTECDKIENLLVEAGAKTYAELNGKGASSITNSSNMGSVVPTQTTDVPKAENNEDNANVEMNLENIQPVSILSNVPQENLKTSAEIKIETLPQLSDKSKQEEQKKKDSVNQNNTDEENTLEEKQKVYDETKAKEQSTANKLLGGLSTAATGIGGMQLMQGLAEQSSDKDAAADMAAYIETMRCTYGDGKQVKAGPDEIELPGANDSEQMKLRSEYLALAADLKERKEALGMKPGIESEVIMDRAQTGLYDDENVGISGGNYGSLYRAQMLNSESDQAKIDDAKNTSGNRVKYGAIAAGAGVVGGILGNELINGKLGEKIKSAKEKKDVDKNEKQALEKLQKCLKNGGAKKTSDLKFEKFTPSVLHIEKISCSGSAWKEKVNNKDATKLFADTTDEATIKETLIKNFDFEIAGKLLEEDLQVQQNQTVQEQQQKPQSQQVEQEQKNQKQQEKQQQSEPEQKTQKDPEHQKQQVSKQEEKQPEQQKQVEDKPQQKQEEQNSEKKQDQKQQEDQQKQEKKQEQKPQKKQEPQQKAPEQKQEAKQSQQETKQKNDKGNVSARKNTNANGTKTKVDIDTFKDVQVNLEQGKKIVELWAAKNNKKNFRFVSKNISTIGQDYLMYQDDTNVYTFEFDDLTELISGTRKEGIGTAICLIYKGKPSTGANFIQCNNVKCSDFMSAAKKIDSNVKEWHAPNLPYGQKTTIYTECRMST